MRPLLGTAASVGLPGVRGPAMNGSRDGSMAAVHGGGGDTWWVVCEAVFLPWHTMRACGIDRGDPGAG